MMPVLEFLALPVDEQAAYVWEHGHFILNRKGGQYNCLLYAVDTYYVEIWYKTNTETIIGIVPFDDIKRLESHLENLSLEELW